MKMLSMVSDTLYCCTNFILFSNIGLNCFYSHALRTLSDLVRAVPTLFIAVQKYSIVSPPDKLSIVIVNIRLVVTLVLVSVIPSVTGVSTEFTTRLHMRVVMVFLGEEQVTL